MSAPVTESYYEGRERNLIEVIRSGSKERLVRMEWLIIRSKWWAFNVVNNPIIATSSGSNGRPLIFRAVENHEEIAEMVLCSNKLLNIHDDYGITVAHAIVIFHKMLAERIVAEKPEVCAMKVGKGLTVELFARITWFKG